MQKIAQINNYQVYLLDKDLAQANITALTALANLIPLVSYTSEDILAEAKHDRIFYGKWEHSLIVFDNQKPIAMIISYERAKEDNDQYPENSLYISELAVDINYQKQGIARKLIKIFLDHNQSFQHLTGDLLYSIQTNSADWNQHVLNLYQSFGFQATGTKHYDNRTDTILTKNQAL